MPTIKVFDMAAKEVGEMNLLDSIFAAEVNEAVLHMAVVNYLANQRQGTQSALTRSEVSGGGRKPWRQKGTGHARQGSTRAPHWTHGGVAFAPKPRDYRFSMNKKAKAVAFKSALSDKVANNELVVVDNIAVAEIKTKTIVNMLNAFNVETKALILLAEADKNVYLSARNIQGVKVAFVGAMNVYDIIGCGKVIASKAAVEKIQEVYA